MCVFWSLFITMTSNSNCAIESQHQTLSTYKFSYETLLHTLLNAVLKILHIPTRFEVLWLKKSSVKRWLCVFVHVFVCVHYCVFHQCNKSSNCTIENKYHTRSSHTRSSHHRFSYQALLHPLLNAIPIILHCTTRSEVFWVKKSWVKRCVYVCVCV